MKLELNPFPQPTAGVSTVKCCMCDWEGVFVMPEEGSLLLDRLLGHIRFDHNIQIPEFMWTTH